MKKTFSHSKLGILFAVVLSMCLYAPAAGAEDAPEEEPAPTLRVRVKISLCGNPAAHKNDPPPAEPEEESDDAEDQDAPASDSNE